MNPYEYELDVIISQQNHIYLQKFLTVAEEVIPISKLRKAYQIFIQDTIQVSQCCHLFTRGKRKGELCGTPLTIGKFCSKHQKKSCPPVNPLENLSDESVSEETDLDSDNGSDTESGSGSNVMDGSGSDSDEKEEDGEF